MGSICLLNCQLDAELHGLFKKHFWVIVPYLGDLCNKLLIAVIFMLQNSGTASRQLYNCILPN